MGEPMDAETPREGYGRVYGYFLKRLKPLAVAIYDN
jgi:hypothetical protein